VFISLPKRNFVELVVEEEEKKINLPFDGSFEVPPTLFWHGP